MDQSRLSFSEMPVSFAGNAFMYGAQSNILNPINRGQGAINVFIRKPVRGVLRLTYQIAIWVLSPFGALYHTGVGLFCLAKHKWNEKKNNAGDKTKLFGIAHLYAAAQDAFALVTFAGLASRYPFFLHPKVTNCFFLPRSMISQKSIQEELRKRELVGQINNPTHTYVELARFLIDLRELGLDISVKKAKIKNGYEAPKNISKIDNVD